MNLRSAALVLALPLCAATALAADQNSFLLVNSAGKTIGRASYSIDPGKKGDLRVRCHFQYRLSRADAAALAPVAPDADPTTAGRGGGNFQAPTEAQFSGEYKLAPDGDLISAFLTDGDTQMTTSFQPSKKRDLVTIGHVQAGSQGLSTDLPVPEPDFLLAPNYDPSAVQMLLTSALTHPKAKPIYLLVVPAPTPRANSEALYVAVQPAPTPDATGTLDGQPVALKHYLLNFHAGHADVYADATGKLMQAEIGPLSTTYIRAGFKLNP